MGVKKEKDYQENRARGWEQFQQLLYKGIAWSVCGRRLHWGYKVFCVVIQQWVLELYRHEKNTAEAQVMRCFSTYCFYEGWEDVAMYRQKQQARKAKEEINSQREYGRGGRDCPFGEVESQCKTDLLQEGIGAVKGREGKTCCTRAKVALANCCQTK